MEMAHKVQTKLPQDDSEVNESSMAQIDQLLCARHSLSDEQTEELERLCAQYNDASQISKRISPNSNKDPLQHLPAELWQNILLLVSVPREERPIQTGQRYRIDQMLIFTMVSASWRESVMSTPSFWTSIGVYRTGDLAAKLVTGLILSKDLPIDLYLDVSLPIDDILRQFIGPASHRIRTLEIASTIWSIPVANNFPSVKTLLEILTELPALEHIYWDLPTKWNDTMNKLVTRSQNIHTFLNCNYSTTTLQIQFLTTPTKLTKLTNFSSGYSPDVILPYLQQLQALRDVAFHLPPSQKDDSDLTRLQIDKQVSHPMVNCLSWKKLSFYQNPRPFLWNLLTPLSSTLVTLNTTLYWDMVPKFLSLLISMSNLRSLTVYLPPLPNKTTNTAFEKQSYDGVSYIDNLSIIYSWSPYFHTSIIFPNNHEDQVNYDILSFMLETLTELAPFVRKLYLSGDWIPSTALLYAASLQRLVKLHLHGTKVGATAFHSIVLEKVEDIRASKMAIVSSIHCPAAMRLSVTDHQRSELLNINTWSNLRTLLVEITPSSWKGISLPRVEEILVDSPYSPNPDEGGSSLLEELALRIHSFPCLSRLRLRRFPEWDILFLMLERRNFPQDNSVNKPCKLIDSITLPFRPASWIAKPLIDRLGAQLSVRPTNYELSHHAIVPIYFDRDIHGCHLCHHAFRNCNAVTAYLNQDGQWQGPGLPIYPATPEEILLSRSERAEVWYDALRSMRLERQQSCNLHYPQEFTRYTPLEDVL